MKKIEPLLKEKEDKFYFLENKQEKKNEKFSKEKITTIIISIFVAWLMWYSFYPFFVGFINFDEGHNSVNKENVKEEEISSTSVIVNNTYSYMDIANNNSLKGVFPEIYSGHKVLNENLNNNLKFAILFKYLGVTCDAPEAVITLEKITETAKKIFNDESFVQNINDLNEKSIYGYTINFDSEGYRITLNACDETSDYTYKTISKATTSGDYLYIYEQFGYFLNTSENNYNIYDSALKQNMLTTYSGNISDFNNIETLKTYKWTYKKNSNGNYYFISITPTDKK